MKKQITAVLLSVVIGAMALAGCGEDVRTDNSSDRLTEEEAKKELKSLMTKVDVTTNTNPTLDIYSEA